MLWLPSASGTVARSLTAMSPVLRTVARVLLGALMVGAGTLHLTTQRLAFRAQVPDWFPIDANLTVIGSGVIEIVLGLAFVLLQQHQRLIGALLAAFFVAVFPGNVAQYVEGVSAFGLDTDTKRLVRLFFQPVLVVWALWAGSLLHRRRRRTPR